MLQRECLGRWCGAGLSEGFCIQVGNKCVDLIWDLELGVDVAGSGPILGARRSLDKPPNLRNHLLDLEARQLLQLTRSCSSELRSCVLARTTRCGRHGGGN